MTTPSQASLVRPVFAVSALLALVGAFFWWQPAPSVDPQTLIDQPVPAFTISPAGPGLPGLVESDLKGRVTLVNFFATWCGPCRGEHPTLMEAKRHGLAIVGIAQDDGSDAVTRFLAERGNPYIRAADDRARAAGHAFGVSGIPQSYLVDARGVIRFVWVGPITEKVLRGEILPRVAALTPPQKPSTPPDDSTRTPAL